MKKTLAELLNELEAKKGEIRSFIDAGEADKAEKAVAEKRDLEKLVKAAEDLEDEEKRSLESQKQKKDNKDLPDKSEFRAIVKTVMGEETTTEERAAVKTTDNAAVLPDQFINNVIELQKGFGSLKEMCDIIPVFKNSGTIPVVDLDQNEMADILEGDDIVDGTLVTTDVPFTVSKVGLIQTLTSELVDDAEVEIESLVNKNFANIATAKENGKILTVVKTNAVATTGATSYADVEVAIDTALPSVKAGLVTLTNVTGYAYLKNLKDKNDRPLNLITEINGVEYFHSKPIKYVEDALLPPSSGKTMVFYIGNMKEAVKFCVRKGITIARSTEAGFSNDTVKIRILERVGAVKGSVRSLKKIEW
ncbi:MAG: phage major capsid protein family [Herbinix sp.]|jgi:HK97 family phage major capsid protein|nr:phage major capsid protein family [Herbinix sp.]